MRYFIRNKKLFVKNGYLMEEYCKEDYELLGYDVNKLEKSWHHINYINDPELTKIFKKNPKIIDFLVYDSDLQDFFFIEVKSCWELFRDRQRLIINEIINLGYPVYLYFKWNQLSPHGILRLNDFNMSDKYVLQEIRKNFCEKNIIPFQNYRRYRTEMDFEQQQTKRKSKERAILGSEFIMIEYYYVKISDYSIKAMEWAVGKIRCQTKLKK